MREFWEKWYFPANATLYVVGDLDRPVEEMVKLIENTLGRVPAAVQALPEGARLALALM